jgi:ABC-2 type transport system permease protein
LLLPVGGFLLLALVAGWLSTRRDVGAGLRRSRAGRAVASGVLVRPLGFALRLHRGLLIGFGVGAALGGAAYGSVFGGLEEMLANVELAEELLAQFEASAVDAFATVILLILAVVVAAYVVLAALRPRAEELAGRAEPVLVTGLSRTRWLASHLTVVLVGSAAVMVAAGAAFGAAAAGTTGDPELFGRITAGSLVYLPALWLTAGLAVALYGWWPRGAGLVWLVPAYGFVVGYLGQLLSMPDWLANLSPFGHVPQLPAHELRWTPLLVLTLIAAALIGLGLAGFRRRDVSGT